MFHSSLSQSPRPTVLLVGADAHGHWLVQEQDGDLEGFFVSRDAALSFARWERHAYPAARVELARDPLVARMLRSAK